MMDKLRKKVLPVVFMFSWFGIYFIAGSLEQCCISSEQAIFAAIVDFITLGVSGFLSELLTLPNERKGKKKWIR